MDKNPKIYIRGNEELEQEILTRLTKHYGARRVNNLRCNDSKYLYFVGHDKELCFARDNSELGAFVKEYYIEEFVYPKWDCHQIVYSESNDTYAEFIEVDDNDKSKFHYSIVFNNHYFDADKDKTLERKDFRKLKESEYGRFISKLINQLILDSDVAPVLENKSKLYKEQCIKNERKYSSWKLIQDRLDYITSQH